MTPESVDVKEVIKEHFRRKKYLMSDYDPIRGLNSPIERFEWKQASTDTLYLPLEMKDDPAFRVIDQHGIEEAAALLSSNEEQLTVSDAWDIFHVVRCKYDFEYWCATCVTIKDNMARKVNFILNPPQRRSLIDLEYMRVNKMPVRDIELKHRQYGSTTMKNAYIFWVQNVVYGNYAVYVCSLDQTGATKIVARYETIVKNYPKVMGNLTLNRYMGLRNTFEVLETECLINIGSAQNPNAPSGDTIQGALISEVGKMKSTDERGAHKLITNIMSMVQLKPDTFVLIESTAEKSGAWFRSQVFKAKRGESGFKLTFISWITDPRCQLELSEAELESFIANMTQYDWDVLWANGASLDQIAWYKRKESEYDYPWEMKQENPTTVDEAFEGAGKKVFTPAQIGSSQSNITKPEFIGEVVSKTGAVSGKEALKDLDFQPDARGRLQVWSKPGFPEPEKEKYISNRYCVFVDIGGTSPESDWSIISVGDRYWQLYGGGPERAAMWRGHVDPDQLAWISAQIAKYYHNALLAVEVNSLYSRGNNTDGVHYLQIFEEITEHYRNVFTRKQSDDVRESNTKYGFHMNHSTKNQLVDAFRKALRTQMWIERSQIVADEVSFFINHDDGTMGAMDGEHDDALIGAMGTNWLAQEYMDPPKIIEKLDYEEQWLRNQRKTEAMI